MKASKKKITILSLSLLSIFACAVSAGATLAGFSAKAEVSRTIDSDGLVEKSIYFNANIWETKKPVYFLKRWQSADISKIMWIPVSKVINVTAGGTAFEFSIFLYDTSLTAYNRMAFFRLNPEGEHIPTLNDTTNYQSSIWPGEGGGDDRTCWNKTGDIIVDNDYSYYCIENWSESSGSCTKAKLSYNTISGTWDGPKEGTNAY